MKRLVALFVCCLINPVYSQDSEVIGVVEVDLAGRCQEEIKKYEALKNLPKEEYCAPTASETIDQLAFDMSEILLPGPEDAYEGCKSLDDLKEIPLDPITVELAGDETPRKKVIVRFTTGLKTVPHDVKTTMNITSPNGNQSIQNFVMKYDTRWQHLDPTSWRSIEDATNFLHESTWGYQIDVLVEGKNKKRTGFSLFLDHPKFKGAMAENEKTGTGFRSVNTIDNRNFGDTKDYNEGDTVYHVQNSHMNIIGGIKISRELWVKNFKNGGRLSYGVNAGAGVNFGISRAVEAHVGKEGNTSPENSSRNEKPSSWKTAIGSAEVQGWTGMVGQAIEYEKGPMSVALSNTLQYSKIKQQYVDGGSASYSLPHMAFALTVSVNVFNSENKRMKKAKKMK